MDSTVPNYNANWEDHFESFEEDEQISYTETKRVFGQIPSKLQAIFDINTKNNIIIAILKERVGAFEEQQHLENFISSDRKAGLMCSETQHLNQETAKCSDLFTQYEDKIRRREEEERILRSNYAAISTVSVERMMMNDPVIRLALEDHVARLKQIISFTCDNYLVVLSKQFRRPIGCHHKVPDDILLERVKSAETKTAEEHYLPNTYKQYYSVRVIAFRGQDRPQETEQPADIKKDQGLFYQDTARLERASLLRHLEDKMRKSIEVNRRRPTLFIQVREEQFKGVLYQEQHDEYLLLSTAPRICIYDSSCTLKQTLSVDVGEKVLLFRLNAQNLFVGTENGIVRVYARQTEGYIIRDVYCCDPSGVIYYHLPLERDIIVYEPHPGGQVYELHTKKWRTMLRGQKPVQQCAQAKIIFDKFGINGCQGVF